MKKYIAILGFGVVGSGCAEVIDRNLELIRRKCGFEPTVKYILDLRDFPESPYADRVVHDYNVILNDPEVELVAEMMGGSHPALEFSLAAMNMKKSVVTSNKEVVSKHGLELLECAEKNGVYYMFEASVGGGIPIIRTLDTAMQQDDIFEIDGILNGTTNYILTRMRDGGLEFDTALAEAKTRGYAEADPSADIEGIDACRKIAILSALAFGKLVSAEFIKTEGICKLTAADVENAKRSNGSVKLIGRAYRAENRVGAFVSPMFVSATDPLSGIDDVYNGIRIFGNAVGDIMLYGRGAGSLPTASAVVSDILNILSGKGVRYHWSGADEAELIDCENVKAGYRVMLRHRDGALECRCTEPMNNSEIGEYLQKLKVEGNDVVSCLRDLQSERSYMRREEK